jgi:hypothetical protein
VVTDYFTMHEILEDEGALVKGRRGLSIRCSYTLRRWCFTNKLGSAVRPGRRMGSDINKGKRKVRTAPYLFHFGAVEQWLEREGGAMIKAHNDKVMGQGTLMLVAVKPKPPEAWQPATAG